MNQTNDSGLSIYLQFSYISILHPVEAIVTGSVDIHEKLDTVHASIIREYVKIGRTIGRLNMQSSGSLHSINKRYVGAELEEKKIK